MGAAVASSARTALGRANVFQSGGIWVLVVALAIVGVAIAPGFASLDNAQNLLRQMAPLAIVAVAQTLVILAGGIDLSVGALMGLVVVITNGIMQGDAAQIPLAIAVALLVGLAIGAFNGAMVVLTRISPLILTFGMLSVVQGVIFVYTDRTIGSSPDVFEALAYGTVGPIPISTVLIASVVAVGYVVLRWTPFGRYLRATGGGAEHARRAGVPVRRVTFAAFILSSLIAAVAGIVLSARLGSGYTLAGAGYEIDSIVAVVLGGTALAGGTGGVLGTLGGVLVLGMIDNLLNLAGVSSYVQQVVKGAIIIAAVAVAALSMRQRRGHAW